MNRAARITTLFLTHGAYAVLCQLTFILLTVQIQAQALATPLLYRTYLPWLEYPLASLTLLIGGSLVLWLEGRSHKE